MPTNFPTSLDDGTSLPTKTAGDSVSSGETNAQSGAIKAIEAKVGITSTGTGYSTTPVVGYELAAASPTGTTAWRADVIVDARDYGAFPTSGADEAAHIQAAITAAASLGGGVVKLMAGTYLVGTVLTINSSGVILEGMGLDVTTVKRTGAATGAVIYLQTPDGTSNKITSPGCRRLTIDGSSTAVYGLRITTVNYADVQQIRVTSCTTSQIFMDCWTSVGGGEDPRDNQHNVLRDIKLNALSSADGLTIDGNAAHDANTSLNRFDNIWAVVVSGIAFHLADCDTNTFSHLRSQDTGTGTGLRLDSYTVANIGHARYNVFFGTEFHCTTAVSAQTGTQPSGPNYIYGYNLSNATGLPTGSGVLHWSAVDGTFDGQLGFPATQKTSTDANTLDDYEEGTWTPALAYATPGSSSWAVTTQAGFYTKIGNRVLLQYTYQGVPTNGTGSGSLQMSGLPFTSNSTSNSAARFACEFQGYTKANFTQITGNINASSSVATFRASGSAQTSAALAVGDIPTGGTVLTAGGNHYFV